MERVARTALAGIGLVLAACGGTSNAPLRKPLVAEVTEAPQAPPDPVTLEPETTPSVESTGTGVGVAIELAEPETPPAPTCVARRTAPAVPVCADARLGPLLAQFGE